MSGISDSAVYGAQVVSKTLDYLNGGSSYGTCDGGYDAQTVGASVVSKTLDYMNNGGTKNAVTNSYNFNKDVLGAYYLGKGAVAAHSV